MASTREAHYDVILIGFGGVNRAFAELVSRENEGFASALGFRLNVVAVADLHLGSLVSTGGIELRRLTEAPARQGSFAQYPGGSSEARSEWIIKEVPADIVIEATHTNPTDGEPATSHCRWALEAGRHVITSNKGPVAFAAKSLKALASDKGLAFAFEGSVMSGTPVIRMANRTLAGVGLRGFEGILNGTCNFVLGRMECGVDLPSAVREAQSCGYAEADPTADIEGHDVRLKVAILANELLRAEITPADVACQGISHLTPDDIAAAASAGQHWKLLGAAQRDERGAVVATVAPYRLPASHRLGNVGGATNAISFKTDLLGDVTVIGPGAGRLETAFALLSDIIAIHQAS